MAPTREWKGEDPNRGVSRPVSAGLPKRLDRSESSGEHPVEHRRRCRRRDKWLCDQVDCGPALLPSEFGFALQAPTRIVGLFQIWSHPEGSRGLLHPPIEAGQPAQRLQAEAAFGASRKLRQRLQGNSSGQSSLG
jgi:hypothetical protein